MKEIKLTLQDYKNSINLCNEWQYAITVKSFQKYMEEKIDELEKPEQKMYKCIKLPSRNNGNFKIGSLYSENYNFFGFPLSDLPKHFELVEPEPKLEKITWEEVKALIQDIVSSGYWPPIPKSLPLIEAINRIKKDHLS